MDYHLQKRKDQKGRRNPMRGGFKAKAHNKKKREGCRDEKKTGAKPGTPTQNLEPTSGVVLGNDRGFWRGKGEVRFTTSLKILLIEKKTLKRHADRGTGPEFEELGGDEKKERWKRARTKEAFDQMTLQKREEQMAPKGGIQGFKGV